jgi:aconitate hydratase
MAFAGSLTFNPMTDELVNAKGERFKFKPPSGEQLPRNGYDKGIETYVAPPEDGSNIQVKVDPKSDRLQLIESFEPWNGKDFIDIPVLIKVKGKCTTDHISPAGKWLIYKGHLENISNNTLIGAVNADTGLVNSTKNKFTGQVAEIPEIAKQYRKNKISWVIIGDHNYGEGSAREHAALQPRYLGCVAVITKSFARIHETNLKKQGILPLTFVNPDDYDLVTGDDLVSIVDLTELKPGKNVTLVVNGKKIPLQHTLNETQIEWFKAGGAVNFIKQQSRK